MAAYTEALKECTRARVPLDWAMTQNNLGAALGILGERESGTERLSRPWPPSPKRSRSAPGCWCPSTGLRRRAILAPSLRPWASGSAGTERLEQAVAAFTEALKEGTRVRVPLDWAMTQNNLGGALGILAERESGTERLEQAVAAFTEALKERTRVLVPLDWAATQSNLGAVLATLGERGERNRAA